MLSFVLRNKFTLINLALWLVFGWLLYLALKWVAPFVLPLIIGLLISILLEPVVRFLHRRVKMPRSIASLTTLLVFFGGGAALLLLLTARMTIELAQFVSRVPAMTAGLVSKGYELLNDAIAFYGSLSPTMAAQVHENLASFGKSLTTYATDAAKATVNGLSQVPDAITVFVLSLLISYLISKDFPRLQLRVMRLVNPSIREKSDVVLEDLGKATFGYLRAQVILLLIAFVESVFGFLILGVPYSLTLGVLAAVGNLIPVVGTGAIFVPWAVYVLITGHVGLGVGLLVLYLIIVITRHVIEPKILAESIGMDPLLTIIVMYAAYKAIGFLGLVLAPFLLIVIMSLVKVHAFDFLLDPETDLDGSHRDLPDFGDRKE